MSSFTNDSGGAAPMKKFMFDSNDFDKKEPVEPPPPMFSEAQIAAAKGESYAEGKKDGVKETRNAQEEKIIGILQKIDINAQRLIADEDRRDIEMMASAVKLAMRMTTKLLPHLSQQAGIGEIERVILQAITSRKDEPRITIFTAPDHIEALQARLDTLAHEKGYTGRLALTADEHMQAGDCRVEWTNGGAERIYERLYADIENEFNQALTGMHNMAAEAAAKDTEN